MPNTTDKILAQLGAQKRAYDQMDQFGLYQSGGHVVEKPEILFMRLDPKEVLAKAEEIKQKQRISGFNSIFATIFTGLPISKS